MKLLYPIGQEEEKEGGGRTYLTPPGCSEVLLTELLITASQAYKLVFM
jgi:hypothetical protein